MSTDTPLRSKKKRAGSNRATFTDTAIKRGDREIHGDDHGFLRLTSCPTANLRLRGQPVRVVDLFCGVGGLSLGLHLAAAAHGRPTDIRLAVDNDPSALACFKTNFPSAETKNASIQEMFSSRLNAPLTTAESSLRRSVGPVDVLSGGPPCQGHSDLNNYTRRNDPKNTLYRFMVRATEVFRPRFVLIENVVGSLHDKGGVVQQAIHVLQSLGYIVDCDFVDFIKLGVPQRRRRLVITGSLAGHSHLASLQEAFEVRQRDVRWAIGDLAGINDHTLLNQRATPNPTTTKRIEYLFTHDLYELPNPQRPPCHRNKTHSYDTVYGRLRWNQPSQTITSGFYCMCMGRYVHPSEPRTLTAHEAARLQFFPDYFDFTPATRRTALAQLIGNAVPPKGGYAIGFDFLSQPSQRKRRPAS
jgi:DNA (cytosine-5)-methyltransferase 1